MDPGSWSIWLGGSGLAAALVLTATAMALSDLSGGVVRKTELRDRDLAARLERWLGMRDRLLVTVRLLLTLDVVLLLACAGSWQAAAGTGTAASGLLFAVFGVVALAFFFAAEWFGHYFSGACSGRFLTFAVPVVRLAGLLVWPLIAAVFLWQRWSERRGNRRTETDERATAEDEILSLVEQDGLDDEKGAELEADERRMIRGIFDLDETLVREIMTPRVDVDAISEDAGIEAVKAAIVTTGHSRIPVYRGTVDQIVGLVYAKDLLDDSKLAGASRLQDLGHRPAFIPESKNIGDLLAEFQQSRNHFAVVLDEYGGTAGIVTFEDILEEIVGEIRDEYDDEEAPPPIERLPDGTVTVDARISIDELNDAMALEIPDDQDFDTLGGYISACAGRIPQAGETLKTDWLEIEILVADPRRVVKARVRRRPLTEDALPK